MKLLSEDLHKGEENWFEEVDEVVFTQKHKMYNWMREAENDNKSNRSSKSSKRSSDRSSKKSSHSSKSKSSKGSSGKASLEQRVLEDKLKMAELLAEASFTEEKHAAILNAEKLRQSEELAKLKARTQVLDKINKGEPDPANMNMGVAKLDEKENQVKADKTVKVERCKKKLNPNAEAFKSKEPHSGEIYSLLKGMIEQQAAPDVEMETFDDNPLEYHHFIELFIEVVEKWIQDPKGRLLKLLKYTRRETRHMIKHCLQEPSYIGYTHAQGLLRQRYGDPHIVLASYRKEVGN